jgi:hypothetical protein
MSDAQGKEYKDAGLTGRMTNADYSGTTAAVEKAYKESMARLAEADKKKETEKKDGGRRRRRGKKTAKAAKKTAGRRRRASRRTMSRR